MIDDELMMIDGGGSGLTGVEEGGEHAEEGLEVGQTALHQADEEVKGRLCGGGGYEEYYF